MSLTDVVPTGPVIPPPRRRGSRRHARASACSAASGSGAASTQPPPSPVRRSVPALARVRAHSGSTTTPQAPASSACAANSPPSACWPGRPKNRSPGRSSRESAIARSGRPPLPTIATSAPAAAAMRSGESSITRGATLVDLGSRPSYPGPAAQPPQLLLGHVPVVEGDFPSARKLLSLLVALAGDHDRVARRRGAERKGDRCPPVRLDINPAGGQAARGVTSFQVFRVDQAARGVTSFHVFRVDHSGKDLIDDRPRLLRARVVGGDHARVGQPGRDLPHQGTLLPVA